HTGYSEEEYVQHLNQLIEQQHLQASGTPEDWANESHLQARQIVEQKPVSIDEQYYQANITLVNKKLALAGLRFAAVLNDALGKAPISGLKSEAEKHSRGM